MSKQMNSGCTKVWAAGLVSFRVSPPLNISITRLLCQIAQYTEVQSNEIELKCHSRVMFSHKSFICSTVFTFETGKQLPKIKEEEKCDGMI